MIIDRLNRRFHFFWKASSILSLSLRFYFIVISNLNTQIAAFFDMIYVVVLYSNINFYLYVSFIRNHR